MIDFQILEIGPREKCLEYLDSDTCKNARYLIVRSVEIQWAFQEGEYERMRSRNSIASGYQMYSNSVWMDYGIKIVNKKIREDIAHISRFIGFVATSSYDLPVSDNDTPAPLKTLQNTIELYQVIRKP